MIRITVLGRGQRAEGSVKRQSLEAHLFTAMSSYASSGVCMRDTAVVFIIHLFGATQMV